MRAVLIKDLRILNAGKVITIKAGTEIAVDPLDNVAFVHGDYINISPDSYRITS